MKIEIGKDFPRYFKPAYPEEVLQIREVKQKSISQSAWKQRNGL